MENRNILIAVDPDGLKLLVELVESLLTNFELETSSPTASEWFSIFMPPSYMSCFEDEELPDGFFEWNLKCDMMKDECLICLQQIRKNVDLVSTTKSDSEFVSSRLHELSDDLPVPGSCILEVYVFGGKESFMTRDLSILTALKRFEVSHHAYFGLLSDHHSDILFTDWLNFIEFNCLSVEDLLSHLISQPVWAGSINIKLQKCSADVSLQHYFLYSADQTKTLSNICTSQNENKKLTFDSKIEIVSMVTLEDLPLHLINHHKFILQTFPPLKAEAFNFFDICKQKKSVFFLGFLKYDEYNVTHKFLTSDWISYVSDPFTHHLSETFCEKLLPRHCTLLMEFDRSRQTLFVYFFKNSGDINVNGFLNLLQSKTAQVNDDMLKVNDKSTGAGRFYQNGADIIPPWQWCEKNSWHEEEHLCKVVKSISRCKSDDFYMQGVMIPGVETLKDGIQHTSLGNILTLFDRSGHPLNTDLLPIPVIDDRLLKNIKCEKNVVGMEYSLAIKVIGHGLDYCIDSLGSLHLAERLLKIQKLLVPQDTLNFTSCKFNVHETAVIPSKKKVLTKDNAHETVHQRKETMHQRKKITIKKESRAEKHKRRLKTIVEGTITKYGEISKQHACYGECCDALFEVCVMLVKKLKSSKDLNIQMKEFAKGHVSQVVASVLAMKEGGLK